MYHRTLAVLAFLLLPTAGAGSTVGSRLPTQDGEPVTGFSETALGRPGHELYLRNNTSSPITITSLTLFECENIRGRCRVREVEWVLDPGEVRRALVVEPRDQARAWNYRWRWTFSRGTAAAPPSAAADPPAAGEVSSAEPALPQPVSNKAEIPRTARPVRPLRAFFTEECLSRCGDETQTMRRIHRRLSM